MGKTKQFKTESKRLLDLMINSIYTNQEIFLRELLSNASDAIDKYHYLSLSDESLPIRNDYEIHIDIDKEKRALTITDNGIGMTYEEVNDNLGTIAKSGTLAFAKKLEEAKNEGTESPETIGQFGVGFYSSFMVAKKVVVLTKSPYSEKGYLFSSTGKDTYEIDECDKQTDGTSITLYLKENTKTEDGKVENDYDRYLDEYTIKYLVKKYSDYIRYPITMYMTKEEPKHDEEGNVIEDEYEEVTSLETLNSMIPLWRKNKNEVTDDELNDFYMQKFYDYEKPMLHLMFNVEGNINYTSLLFIPNVPPRNLHSVDYEKGLQLYSKGVFIMDKCKELIPDYLRFVKGIVDSSDLSLNISREMLQQNKVLKLMQINIEKKIINKLSSLQKDDFDKYVEFFKNYGINLKFGAYENYGSKKELLQDLLIYQSVNSEKMITFKEYVENMKEGQKDIYYTSAKSKDEVLAMPQMDQLKKHGYDVLILTDDVDEFLLKMFNKYGEHEFKSINQASLDEIATEEEKAKQEEVKKNSQGLLDALKEALKDEVKDVVISTRLIDSPVCLVSGDGISFEMEKVIEAMPTQDKVRADRILEINPNHELFNSLEEIYKNNPEDIKDYAFLLYNQALLIEGFKPTNSVEFSNLMCKLMIKSSK
ncbi:MAG: molecular chaperone HtpG [Bacilli bacterium]